MGSRNGGGNGGRSKRSAVVAARQGEAQHTEPEVRVELRPDDAPGPGLRIMLSNMAPGRGEVDLTRSFTSSIAHALWMARGGDDTQNWVDAERLLDSLLGPRAQRPDRRVEPERITGPLPDPGLTMPIRRNAATARS